MEKMPKKISTEVDERKEENKWIIGGDFNARTREEGWRMERWG